MKLLRGSLVDEKQRPVQKTSMARRKGPDPYYVAHRGEPRLDARRKKVARIPAPV